MGLRFVSWPGVTTRGDGKGPLREFSEVREVFDLAEETLKIPLKELCFEGPIEALTQTENAQPALLTVQAAIMRMIPGLPSVMAGHSLGEYSAYVASQALSFQDALRVVRKRGELMAEVPGRVWEGCSPSSARSFERFKRGSKRCAKV